MAASIAGVAKVERDDGQEGGFVVEMAEGRDAREEIAARAVAEGWGLLEMRPITLSLEEIFIRIIQGEAA